MPVVQTQFRILGPLEVLADGRPVALGGPQQRGLLALLLLQANRVVSRDRLISDLWAADPPATARALLHGCVAGLRRVLPAGPDGARLLTRSPGYLLRVGPGELDADRFEQLDEGGAPTEALQLWRGPALQDVPLDACRTATTRLDERRLAVLERRVDLDLQRSRFAELVAELTVLVQEHPLRERLWAQLMLALYGTGRQADALAAFRALRAVLVEELAIEPGALVRRVQRSVLAGEDALTAYWRETGGAPAGPTVVRSARGPAQLPAAIPGFTGRTADLDRLDGLLAGEQALAVVVGPAGVGKTTLAVHWAHRVAEQFPDGQLYVNLRGFDPVRAPMDPADAVRGFLDSLGVAAQRIPMGLDARAATYRSVLAGKRVLVVLDNARDAEQVRLLLPGSPGCLVVVTGRGRLTPLVATAGAHTLVVDLLGDTESRELLTLRLGADRTAAEQEAVSEIVTRCSGLPLALAIVAARAGDSTGSSLPALAAELRDAAGALDSLDAGDPATDVRAVFSWSYQALDDDAARMFRLLGLHPGPDLTAAAAASLAGVTPRRAVRLLAELTRAHMLTEQTPGRYSCHDLLRLYAAERARAHEDDDDRGTAVRRMLDHYLHTAHRAAGLLYGAWYDVELDAAHFGVTPERPSAAPDATQWLTTEHRVLIAMVECAATTAGVEDHAWLLARSLKSHFQQQCHWPEWAAAEQLALGAAQRTGSAVGLAQAHSGLGTALTYMGRYDEARIHLEESLDRFTRLGDLITRGRSHLTLGMLFDRLGVHDEALDHTENALALFRSAGHRPAQAAALNGIGWLHTEMGRPQEALDVCRQALDVYEAGGDRPGQAATWDSLGHAHHCQESYLEAIACYTRAVAVNRDLGDRYHEAESLTHIGDTHEAAGDDESARLSWRQALCILDELDHPDAHRIRTKLRDRVPAGSS